GYNRDFISEEWPWMDMKIWDDARIEAEDLANYDQPLEILGTDIDHRMVKIAKENALEAGLSDLITFKQMQATDFTTTLTDGVIVSNPPYGERIGEREEIERVIRELGKIMRNYPTWSVYMLSSMDNFEELYGKKATKKRKLFNGFIRTDFYQFWGQKSNKQSLI
nr:RNA methyltransferase [Bacilli bacterium]